MEKDRILIVCTTDSMIWNFLVPHIKRLENDGYIVECACSVTCDFFDNLVNQYGLIMHKVDFARSPYSFKNINALFRLKRIVKERNIGTIFCHEPVGGAMGRVVGHIAGCKVIYMAHGFHFFKGASRSSNIYYAVEKYLSKYTDVLITINQEDYKASLGFKAKDNYLLPGIGIDTSRFAYNPDREYLRKEIKLEERDLILISVGELITRKNHETVIDAIAELKKPHIHYVIAGEGELEQHLMDKIKGLGLNNVHLLGYRSDINKLCNSSDIFVMPSFQEGLSVAMMEAMACSLPIIASRIRGNVDLIENCKGGYLVDVKDVKGYMEAVEKLSSSPEDRDKMGKYNMKKVKAYSIDNVAEMLIPIIEKNGSGGGTALNNQRRIGIGEFCISSYMEDAA